MEEDESKVGVVIALAEEFVDDWDETNKEGGADEDIQRAKDARDDLASVKSLMLAAPKLMAALQDILSGDDSVSDAACRASNEHGFCSCQRCAIDEARKLIETIGR